MRVAHTPRVVRVMATGFNELEILSQRALIEETLIKLLDTYTELVRREDANTEFLKTFCSLNQDTWVWYLLWEAGSAQRYTDLLRAVQIHRPTLSKILQKLLKEGLVRKIGMRYQAVVPPHLVKISLLNESKS